MRLTVLATKVKFYFDEHSARAVEKGLLKRGYEVVMAVDVGMMQKDDDTEHLSYATEQALVIFTRDEPFAAGQSHQNSSCNLERP